MFDENPCHLPGKTQMFGYLSSIVKTHRLWVVADSVQQFFLFGHIGSKSSFLFVSTLQRSVGVGVDDRSLEALDSASSIQATCLLRYELALFI
jgi:hypothetical protein